MFRLPWSLQGGMFATYSHLTSVFSLPCNLQGCKPFAVFRFGFRFWPQSSLAVSGFLSLSTMQIYELFICKQYSELIILFVCFTFNIYSLKLLSPKLQKRQK